MCGKNLFDNTMVEILKVEKKTYFQIMKLRVERTQPSFSIIEMAKVKEEKKELKV